MIVLVMVVSAKIHQIPTLVDVQSIIWMFHLTAQTVLEESANAVSNYRIFTWKISFNFFAFLLLKK